MSFREISGRPLSTITKSGLKKKFCVELCVPNLKPPTVVSAKFIDQKRGNFEKCGVKVGLFFYSGQREQLNNICTGTALNQYTRS